MRKFLVLAVGLLMFLAADAAPTYDVGQQQTDQVLLMQQTDGSQMVVDFVYADYSVVTIATTTETEYTIYQAQTLPRCVPKYSTLLCLYSDYAVIDRMRLSLIYTLDGVETTTETQFEYETVRTYIPISSNKLLQAVITDAYPSDYEQKLVNEYKAFLQARSELKSMVESDCKEAGIR